MAFLASPSRKRQRRPLVSWGKGMPPAANDHTSFGNGLPVAHQALLELAPCHHGASRGRAARAGHHSLRPVNSPGWGGPGAIAIEWQRHTHEQVQLGPEGCISRGPQLPSSTSLVPASLSKLTRVAVRGALAMMSERGKAVKLDSEMGQLGMGGGGQAENGIWSQSLSRGRP